MEPNNTFRQVSELKPGDVLLCYSDPEKGFVARKIKNETDSEYCHAAIYYGNSLAAESRVKTGVKKGRIEKINVNQLVSRYDHVAVLRQPDAWSSDDRVTALQLFVDQVVDNEAKYNLIGAFRFKNRKEFHQANMHEKLKDYFDGKVTPLPTEKATYFCSEFVCDCFISVGFIHSSAAVIFQSDTYAPGDLGKESAFGTFWGYLTAREDYAVSERDFYYRATTYDAIFGA